MPLGGALTYWRFFYWKFLKIHDLAIAAYKLNCTYQLNFHQHSCNTRPHDTYTLQCFQKFSRIKQSLSYLLPTVWNFIPANFKLISFNSLKIILPYQYVGYNKQISWIVIVYSYYLFISFNNCTIILFSSIVIF